MTHLIGVLMKRQEGLVVNVNAKKRGFINFAEQLMRGILLYGIKYNAQSGRVKRFTCWSHKPEIAGSTPVSATKLIERVG